MRLPSPGCWCIPGATIVVPIQVGGLSTCQAAVLHDGKRADLPLVHETVWSRGSRMTCGDPVGYDADEAAAAVQDGEMTDRSLHSKGP